jgi:hypothetical protein
MRKRNISLTSAPGAESSITAQGFFKNGIADATVFLDHFEPLTPNMKVKYNNFWELLRSGNRINNMLMKRTDKDGIGYAWAEIELGRGVTPFKVVLFSDEMLNFLLQYQKAQVTVRFTLQELLDEAQRIESGNPQSGGQSSATV